MNVSPTAAPASAPRPTGVPAIGHDLVGSDLLRIAPSASWRNSDVVRGARLLEGPADGFASVEDARRAIATSNVEVTEPGARDWQTFLVITAQVGDRFVNVLGDAPANVGDWDNGFPVMRTRDDRVAEVSDLIVPDTSGANPPKQSAYSSSREVLGPDTLANRAKDALGLVAVNAGEATIGRVLDEFSWG